MKNILSFVLILLCMSSCNVNHLAEDDFNISKSDVDFHYHLYYKYENIVPSYNLNSFIEKEEYIALIVSDKDKRIAYILVEKVYVVTNYGHEPYLYEVLNNETEILKVVKSTQTDWVVLEK